MTESGASGQSKRIRGVQASRERLSAAMVAAGLKSQAELARRIADREGLEQEPKDLVSRAFRQIPVDHGTLQRIADALEVEAHKLYLVDRQPASAGEPAIKPSRLRWSFVATSVILIVATAAVVWQTRSPVGKRLDQPNPSSDVRARAGIRDVRVGIIATDEVTERFAAQLRSALEGQVSLLSAQSQRLMGDLLPNEALSRLNLNVVLRIQSETRGRFVGVVVTAHSGSSVKPVWVETESLRDLETDNSLAVERAAGAVIETLAGGRPAAGMPSVAAQADYLDGLFHHDRSKSELSTRRALTSFEAALRKAPNYVKAHAGLCSAIVGQTLNNDDRKSLGDAEQVCIKALQLDPKSPEALIAMGQVQRKLGNLDSAFEALDNAKNAGANGFDWLHTMGLLHLDKYLTGDKDSIGLAESYLKQAIAYSPEFWKGPYSLGRLLYMRGDAKAGVAQTAIAATLEPSGHVFNNLGSIHFCLGDLESAKHAYERAVESDPTFGTNRINLGSVYYFLERFDEAVDEYASVIGYQDQSAEAGKHELWANYADSLRRAGRADEALVAYRRAAELAERDLSMDIATANTRAFLIYYYTEIELIETGELTARHWSEIETELAEARKSVNNPNSMLRLAQVYFRQGDAEQAKAAVERLGAQCPGYVRHPDLPGLFPSA